MPGGPRMREPGKVFKRKASLGYESNAHAGQPDPIRTLLYAEQCPIQNRQNFPLMSAKFLADLVRIGMRGALFVPFPSA